MTFLDPKMSFLNILDTFSIFFFSLRNPSHDSLFYFYDEGDSENVAINNKTEIVKIKQ